MNQFYHSINILSVELVECGGSAMSGIVIKIVEAFEHLKMLGYVWLVSRNLVEHDHYLTVSYSKFQKCDIVLHLT